MQGIETNRSGVERPSPSSGTQQATNVDDVDDDDDEVVFYLANFT